MTDEVKQLIDVMAMLDRCSETPCCKCEQLKFNDTIACSDETAVYQHAAKLLETFCSELEQVKRERDAAVEDLKLWHCFSCNNQSTPYCQECSRNRVRLVKGYLSGRNHYEWRGAKMDRKE